MTMNVKWINKVCCLQQLCTFSQLMFVGTCRLIMFTKMIMRVYKRENELAHTTYSKCMDGSLYDKCSTCSQTTALEISARIV